MQSILGFIKLSYENNTSFNKTNDSSFINICNDFCQFVNILNNKGDVSLIKKDDEELNALFSENWYDAISYITSYKPKTLYGHFARLSACWSYRKVMLHSGHGNIMFYWLINSWNRTGNHLSIKDTFY